MSTEGRNRTGTNIQCSRDFKSLVSTSFTTSATTKSMRRRPDSNWCMAVLQTAALPLGYDAKHKRLFERKKGFEPSTLTLAT